MDMSIFVAFWCVSILFIITPGMDWAYIISASQNGRHVISAVTGLLLGHFTAIAIVASGIGSIVTAHPTFMTILTYTGASYLLWIGLQMLTSPATATKHHEQYHQSGRVWFFKGTCISGLNPKVFLLFLALLPQFTDPQSLWPLPIQLLALGCLHVLSCGAVYLSVGYFSKAVLRTRPAVSKIISRASGFAMMAIAIGLFAEQISR